MNWLIMFRYLGENVARFIDADPREWYQHETEIECLRRVGQREVPRGLEYFVVSRYVVAHDWPDGRCAITHPWPSEWLSFNGDYPSYLAHVVARNVRRGAAYSIIPHVEIPHNRRLRNAWQHEPGRVIVNPERARLVLVEQAKAHAMHWHSYFLGAAMRMQDARPFHDALWDMPERVRADVAEMTVGEMHAYPMPLPDLPECIAERFAVPILAHYQQSRRECNAKKHLSVIRSDWTPAAWRKENPEVPILLGEKA